MTNYLTLKKILLDSVALYRAHVLYITVLIGAVLAPYSLMITADELPDIFILVIPVFIILMMMVEMISTSLASTSYVDKDFIISLEFKKNIIRVFPYLLITLLAALISFFGLSLFVIPGIITTIVFNLIKVDYVVNQRKANASFKEVITMLKTGTFIKVLKIYMLPTALQFLIALAINPFLKPESLEQDIINLYPYVTVALIVIFPVAICFRTALYFNIIKQNQLNTTNQLV